MNTSKKGFLERVKTRERDYSKSEKQICSEKLKAFYDLCNTAKGIENNILGSRIKFIRKSKNIKITTLADKCYVDRSTIYRIENGENKTLPWFDTISKIVFALDYDIDSFVMFPDDNEKWKRILRASNPVSDSFIEEVQLPTECELNKIKAEIFNKLDSDYIYYEEEGKKIIISDKNIELLRINIYNAFETLEYILKK